MKSHLGVVALSLLVGSSVGQRGTATTSDRVEETGIGTSSRSIVTPTGTGEPCAQVSDLQESYFSEEDGTTLGPFIQASLANACADSAPIAIQDAIDLIDGLLAMVQFQSTLDFLDNPPAGHQIAAVNLVDGLNSLRDRVSNNEYTSEVAFQTDLTTLLASAHDGHLAFYPDALGVFRYGQQFGSLVSVSDDGVAAPQLYLYNEMLPYLNGVGEQPSAIEQINGVDATEYITQQTLNSSYQAYQDADAAYNAFLWSPNRGEGFGPDPGVFAGSTLGRYGDSTSIRFTNGTTVERENFAVPALSFRGVRDGADFYDAFCNVANKAGLLSKRSEPTVQEMYEKWKKGGYWQRKESGSSKVRRQSSSEGPIQGYPEPEVISNDASIAGFFLTEQGFEDVAVLLVRSFSLDEQDDFQSTLTTFLDSCRSNNKQRLIIDMTGNPGGIVGLGYDMFKQLFPDLDPWGAGNFRAHEGFQLLGEAVTELSSAVLRQFPDDYSAFEQAFGTTPYAAETKLDLDGTNFDNFADFYGPVQASNDQGSYTNLFRLDLDNPQFSESFSGIVISGYDDSRPLAPQPFESENMVILTDGQCSSTCAMVSHLLKWQGKVKSVALGGRPQTGPMQTVGGVKGSQVQTFIQLFAITYGSYLVSDSRTRSSWTGTTLDTILQLGEYVLLRTRSAGEEPAELAFNVQNNIAEGDRSLTPLQFVYEAADCRLYYQPSHIQQVSTRWNTVAAQAFGLDGATVFSACVEGSTNQPSSLSGNAELYNDGQPTNATSETQDYEVTGTANTGNGGDGGDENSGNRSVGSVSLLSLVVALTAGVLMM